MCELLSHRLPGLIAMPLYRLLASILCPKIRSDELQECPLGLRVIQTSRKAVISVKGQQNISFRVLVPVSRRKG